MYYKVSPPLANMAEANARISTDYRSRRDYNLFQPGHMKTSSAFVKHGSESCFMSLNELGSCVATTSSAYPTFPYQDLVSLKINLLFMEKRKNEVLRDVPRIKQ